MIGPSAAPLVVTRAVHHVGRPRDKHKPPKRDGSVPRARKLARAREVTIVAMVRISTRGDYACRALLSLALHADTAGPTSVRDIAERTALPQPYLEQILLALKGAGLVKSKRGVGGGYVLAREPESIRLSEIVSAVDGPITLGDFGQPHQDGACDHEGQCVLLGIWNQAGDHMRTYLEGFTLAGIAAIARGDAPWP
jgi:Rrf2 family protein